MIKRILTKNKRVNSLSQKIATYVQRRDWVQALVLALIVVLPICLFLVSSGRVMIATNILPDCCGWNYTENRAWAPLNREISDTVDYILPMKMYTYEELQNGNISFWNPYYFGGGEFFSNSQSAILHPLNVLYFLTDPLTAHTISVILNIAVMIFGMYMLLKRVGLRWFASGFGALAFAGTPWFIFWLEWGTIDWIISMWPLILYSLYRLRETKYRSPRWLAAATALIGLQMYFGHLQFSLFTFVIVGIWWGVVLVTENRDRLRLALIAGASVIISIAIGGLTLVNTLTMASSGHRSGEQVVSAEAILKSDIDPLYQLISLSTDRYSYVPTTIQLEVVRVLFIIGIIIVLRSLVYRRVRFDRNSHFLYVFIAIWLAGLGFAFSLPIFREVLKYLPGAKGMLHHYFIALPVIAGPVLAAVALQKIQAYSNIRLRRNNYASGRYSIAISALVTVCALVCIVYAMNLFLLEKLQVTYSWVAAILLILFIIASWFRVRVAARILSIGVLSVLLLHIFGYIYAYTPMPPVSTYYAGNPSLECIARDSRARGIGFSRAISVLSANTHMIKRVGVLNGYDSLHPRTTQLFHDALNYPSVQRPVYGDNALLSVNLSKTQLNQNLGVNYLIDYANMRNHPGYTPICNDPTGRYQVFRSNTRAEAIYFAKSVKELSHSDQLVPIRDNSLEDRQVLLDHTPSTKISEGVVRSYTIDGNKITAETTNEKDGLLFIAQSYNEGWVAKVDGKQTPIHRANYMFMALPIDAGNHHIELTFTPKNFVLSISVTIFGVIALALLTLAYSRIWSTRLHR